MTRSTPPLKAGTPESDGSAAPEAPHACGSGRRRIHRRFVHPVAAFSTVTIIALCVMLVTGLSGCASVGKRPSAKLRETFLSSPHYDAARGVFINLPEPVLDSFWAANRARFRAGVDVSHNGAAPDFALPVIKPDLAAFTARDSGLQIIWLGHSSLLLRMDSATILLDPVFGRASPLSFYESPRFQPPPFRREETPHVDVIIISHEHYDHLEYATVKYFAKRNTTFIVPLGISSHLLHWGVKPERIIVRDWWDSVTVKGVEFIATPALHSSGRLKRGSNLTQWASWVLRTGTHAVYFSGDTGYGSHFRMIGERFGPFDVVFLETGQYSRAWRSHLQPHHWPVAMKELRSGNWFPIHWGVFSFAPHDWDDPIVAADSLARNHGLNLLTPRMGEPIDVDALPAFTSWWVKERPDE